MGHVGGEVPAELVLLFVLPGQVLHLLLELPVLGADALHQGLQLLIGGGFGGVLEVNVVDGLHNLPGGPGGGQEGQHRRQGQGPQGGGQGHPEQGQAGGLLGGEANHGAVGDADGEVAGSVAQGAGVADALSEALAQGLLNLLPVSVVVHGLRRDLRVTENRAVGGNPGDAAARLWLQTGEVGHSADLHRPGDVLGLGPEVAVVLPGELPVGKDGENGDTHQGGGCGHGEAAAEDPAADFQGGLFHEPAPIL